MATVHFVQKNLFSVCYSLSLFLSLSLSLAVYLYAKQVSSGPITKQTAFLNSLPLKGKQKNFQRGQGINILTKGILLNKDTMDFIMLVIDEQKKVVIFLFLS